MRFSLEKKLTLKLSVFLSLVFSSFSFAFSQEFEKISSLGSDIRHLAAHCVGNNLLFAASSRFLWRSQDKGKSWEKAHSFPSDITYIFCDKIQSGLLFVLTSSNLYLSSDAGKSFRRIYRARTTKEGLETLLSFNRRKEIVYLGTSSGLYKAALGVFKWKKVLGLEQAGEVFDIAFAPQERILIAARGGVYEGEEREGFRRIFVNRSSSQDEGISLRRPTCLIGLPEGVYLGTYGGLYYKKHSEEGFEKQVFFPAVKINSFWYDKGKNALYVATEAGLYILGLSPSQLELVYSGIGAQEVNDVAAEGGILFAATAKGLYEKRPGSFNYASVPAGDLWEKEPTIRQVQEAALRYNQVHPDKIRKWKRALKLRALMPSVNLSYDKSVYGTAGTSTYDGKAYVGPRDWGVSLSWDVGDLVWNTYEDDVDTRARLNTQLRLDILDDVNRIYFARRRLELELLKKKQMGNYSQYDLLKDQMRLEELTASLDGYTGGFFSARLKALRKN